MDPAPTTPPTPRRQRLRHGLRRAGRLTRWVLLGVAGLLLVSLLVLALPAGREFLLRTGLDLVARDLADREPASELTVGQARWPQAGNLSFSDVVWTAGPDTLARIETLRLQLDLADLWRRDLTVRLAEVKGLSVDLPAVQAYLPAGDTSDTVAETEPAAAPIDVPFLRSGAWPAFPSVAIERLTLARVALTTAPDLTAHLDSLDLSLELRHGRRPNLAASLRARPLSTLGVSWRLQGTIDADTLDLALAPLHLAAPARLPAERDLPLDGRLRLPLAVVDSLLGGSMVWPSLMIDQLMIEGDAGTWRLDASLEGRTRGQIVLNSELPDAPVALLAGLANLAQDTTVTRARLDLLASRWSEHGRPGVELTLDITPPPPAAALDQASVHARGRLRLPAPAAIASLLPPQLMVADLGPIDLDLAALYDGTTDPAALTVDLDLGRTAWLDQAQLHLSGDLESIHQAGFDLRLPGLAIAASGHTDRDSLQLDLTLEVPDATLLERWRDPTLADLVLETSLRVQASGPWSRPRAQLQMSATAASPQFTLPRAEITASVAGDSIRLHAGLPSGLQILDHEVSRLDLNFHGSVTDSLRHLQGHLDFAAQAPPVAMTLRGQLDLRDPATDLNLSFDGDHLALSLDRRKLTSTRPWQLAFSAADTTVQLEGLQLAGSLGHLDLQGRATPGQIDAVLDLELRLLLDTLRPLLPEANQAQLPAGTVNIVGQGRATGPPAAVWASGSLQVAIVDQPANDDLPNLTGLAAHLHASLGGQGPAPTTLDPGPLGWQAGRARLQGSLLDHETTLASLNARIPWPLAGTASDSLDLHLSAPALDLGRLAQLLPPDHEVGGQLSIDTHIQGRLPAGLADLDSLQNLEGLDYLELVRDLDLVLAGNLHLQDLALRLADGTRIILAGDLDLQGTSRSPLVTADLALSGDLGNVDVQASVRPDSLAASVDLALELDSEALRPYLPLEQRALLPRGNLALGGMIDAAGSIEAPWATGNLQMQVIDQPEVSALTSSIDLLVGGRGAVPAHLEGDDRLWRAESLRLRLRLLDAGAELLRLSALVPLPHLTAEADSVDLRLDADALDLSRLAPLLPAGISLSGRFDAATRVNGQVMPGEPDPDLDLSGGLSVADLRLQLPDGSRVALRGQVELAGTSLAPQIRGGLHIEGGLLRLPDPPPTLLPATGGALLWKAEPGETATASQPHAGSDMTTASALADTAGGRAADGTEPPEPPAGTAAGSPAVRAILPELVFTVTSPGGLWLRGQGLDVELAGDLSLLLRSGQLAIEGELQAIQGTMSQLGHTFRLERGRITFDGSETELNPELDLVLSVLVGEYRISILLGGSAQVPSLQFSSEPELSEGDILATLLFGKPLAELDEGQTGLLASRAAQIAAAYGSARLSESLARQLGVDVVSIAPREGDEETTALTIGKYLSPRVMVRYEQLLREGSAFFVHLDYRFAGAFRLHTQVSQGEESGLQLKWQQDW